jgi:hypothetical protein
VKLSDPLVETGSAHELQHLGLPLESFNRQAPSHQFRSDVDIDLVDQSDRKKARKSSAPPSRERRKPLAFHHPNRLAGDVATKTERP